MSITIHSAFIHIFLRTKCIKLCSTEKLEVHLPWKRMETMFFSSSIRKRGWIGWINSLKVVINQVKFIQSLNRQSICCYVSVNCISWEYFSCNWNYVVKWIFSIYFCENAAAYISLEHLMQYIFLKRLCVSIIVTKICSYYFVKRLYVI